MRKEKNCRECIWCDQCHQEVICDNYDNGSEFDFNSKQDKSEFYTEWFSYVIDRQGGDLEYDF